MRHEFTCWDCKGHRFYVDANDKSSFPIRYCIACGNYEVPTSNETINVEPINRNEITSLAQLAASMLVGRKMVLSGQIVHINSVWLTTGSRMSLTVATAEGQTKRIYLPSKIELIPIGAE